MQHAEPPTPANLAPRTSWRTIAAVATLARYTAAEAIHSRLLVVAGLTIAAGIALGQFAMELALTDTRGIGAASQAWLFRLAAAFLIAGFAISSLVREANDKGLELFLSLPLPRAGYLLGKWSGCTLVAALLAAVFALPLFLTAPATGVAAWGLSLFLELAIVASASLLCALTLTHTVASLAAVSAFYALSRAMAAMLAIGAGAVAPVESGAYRFATTLLDAIATLLPRLDQFGRTQWLIGDTATWTDLRSLAGQAFVYITLLLAAAYVDLMRKSV
jgi:ABC-type transport system involved in multi-copper enzyme maturation permease subunit